MELASIELCIPKEMNPFLLIENDPIGKLVHDFDCKESSDMIYPISQPSAAIKL